MTSTESARSAAAATPGATCPERADAHRGRDVLDDDRVADDDAHERLVLGREAERIGEASDDAFDGGATCVEAVEDPRGRAARDVRGIARDDRRAALACRGEVREELDATGDVVDDDVLEMRAEEAGERCRQVGGRLDAVGEEPREALVLRLDERLGAGADALATGVHLGERVEA